MPTQRDVAEEAARNAIPRSAKRTAPPPSEDTREDREWKRFKYGTVTSFRWKEDFRQLLSEVTHRHRVRRSEFVEYCVRLVVLGLEQGKFQLPVEPDGNRIKMPGEQERFS